MQTETIAERDGQLIEAISEIGDAWTLLIAWAISRGVTRFDALQRELGVARNILSERLRKKMRLGLIEKRPISEGARRMEYRLTEKGAALAGALGAFQTWADEWWEESRAMAAHPPQTRMPAPPAPTRAAPPTLAPAPARPAAAANPAPSQVDGSHIRAAE